MYELFPAYDSARSFYGKAVVRDYGVLESYGTPVARRVLDGSTWRVELYPSWAYSATTLRHVKEFIRQTLQGQELPCKLTKSNIAKQFAVIC